MTTIEDIPILEPSCTKVATTEFSKLEPFLVENFPQNLEKVVDTLLLNNTIGFHLSVLEAYRYFSIFLKIFFISIYSFSFHFISFFSFFVDNNNLTIILYFK